MKNQKESPPIETSVTTERTRASGAEKELSTRITQNAEKIALKVSSGDVTSLIEQSASDIRLKALTIRWSSTYHIHP